MTRIAYEPRQPVERTKRKRFSWPIRDELLDRQMQMCARVEVCGTIMEHGKFAVDHVLPLELGGSNDIENLQALCFKCHREKSREDIARIAKARRLRTPRQPKRRIQSRGFSKTLSRHFDRTVTPRQ